MDIYVHVNMGARRGAAGAVPEMPWACGRGVGALCERLDIDPKDLSLLGRQASMLA